ncbi:type IV secretion system protein [Vibrio chagasii]|uniref:type IV secretion system protein n=1 Tax=Vibrio chagasii TaxID=170679 RepID=UPI002283D489|nr:type IV secretion system protein [Vibrio chagasii]MCY9828838.1 type IV secretion system protein [Vibrio chagasii]
MSADTVFRQTFLADVTQFITQVMSDPVIEQASFGLLIFLCGILYFQEVARFMLFGFEPEKIAQSTLMVLIVLSAYPFYSSAFDVLFEGFDDLGLRLLELGIGSRDPMFLFKWVSYALAGMYGEEVSLWDMSLGDVMIYFLWVGISFLLVLAMYFIGAWAVWSLLLAKILGVFFFPMLVHPATRSLFDGWMRFTFGSLLLLVVVRAAGVLAAIAIKAQFTASGVLQCPSGLVAQCTELGGREGVHGANDYMDLLVTMILAVAIVVSSMGLTSSIAGSVSSPSAAVGRGVKGLTDKVASKAASSKILMKFLTKGAA